MSYYFSRLSLASLFVLAGIIVSSGGLLLLKQLGQVYRTVDLSYPESEQTFYNWLAAAVKQYGRNSNQLADLIAERLLMMGIHDRRDVINSMMIDQFWDELAPPGIDRTPIFALMSRATRTALKSAPLNGDLWLYAAWLRTRINRFDDIAAAYFLLSQRFTPREEALVLQRLDFITQLVKTPPVVVKAAAIADVSVVQRFNAEGAKKYSEQLQR